MQKCVSCMLSKELPGFMLFKDIEGTLKYRLYVTKLGNKGFYAVSCSLTNSYRIFNHTCTVTVTGLR